MVEIKKIKLSSLKNISALLKARNIDLINAQVGDVNLVLEEDGALERFVIEKIATDEVSFCFYYTQNGDLMCDPDLVFVIKEIKTLTKSGVSVDTYLIPKSFENSSMGAYNVCFEKDGDKVRFNPRSQQGIISLARDMDNNIGMRKHQF